MLPVDASALYDLPEAARLLLEDPTRLGRLARRRRIPSIQGPEGLRFPRNWVDARVGTEPADADALAAYWLERLAPAEPDAARPSRDRRGLPAPALLDVAETCRRLTADEAFLRRLDAEGELPGLLVDGRLCYDAELVELLSTADDEEGMREADRRRAGVLAWARHAWVTGLDEGAPPPPARTRPAPKKALGAAPRAWQLPEDLTGGESPPPDGEGTTRDRLIEADGYDTLDEED